MNKNMERITTANEAKVLTKLAAPMMFGIMGMLVFNLVDTFFVGQLGKQELAALSFTFPVVLFISSIAHGLGISMTAVVSKSVGRQEREKQIRVITGGMLLSFTVVIFFVFLGQLTINPIFTLLGADKTTLGIIHEYMGIWYWGVIFVVVPMSGNAAIRGLGDTKTPSLFMLMAATINMILDPLFIFGIGPFPQWGVAGAAFATVLGRSVTFCVTLYILIYREKVISFKNQTISSIKEVWRELLQIGIPTTLSKIIIPLASAAITALIANHGLEAVAGFGIATRLDIFAMLVINSVVAIIPIFIGQNWGAGKSERVIRGIKLSYLFSLAYGIVIYLIFYFAARPIASLFNSDPMVVDVAVKYMRIVPLAYGLQGIMLLSMMSLNVLGKPIQATLIALLQMFGLCIPLAFAGSYFFGFNAVFAAIALSYAIAGPISYLINSNHIRAQIAGLK